MTTLTYGQVMSMLLNELKNSSKLRYVPNVAIIQTTVTDKDVLPTFTNYLIRLCPPDSGFMVKQPRIGRYSRNTYVISIELWIKSGSSLANRLTKGNFSAQKGLYEFFADVSGILEHNTFNGQLDPYPGTQITVPANINTDDKLTIGMSFLWYGNQDSIL